MDLSNLTPELKEKADACKTLEELLALAEEEGVELTDQQIQEISGGISPYAPVFACRRCYSVNYKSFKDDKGNEKYKCLDCGYVYEV